MKKMLIHGIAGTAFFMVHSWKEHKTAVIGSTLFVTACIMAHFYGIAIQAVSHGAIILKIVL